MKYHDPFLEPVQPVFVALLSGAQFRYSLELATFFFEIPTLLDELPIFFVGDGSRCPCPKNFPISFVDDGSRHPLWNTEGVG